MIRFQLGCKAGHCFEGWFSGNEDFDYQRAQGLLDCPQCGSSSVDKLLMTPTIPQKGKLPAKQREQLAANHHAVAEKIRALHKYVTSTAENVGTEFAEKARKIHYGEADPRGIYGKTSSAEAMELLEEGITVLPLPDLPENKN